MSMGPMALVGSGEFLPVMAEVDAGLLDARPLRVAVIPTAAAPEGDRVVRRWFGLAHRHYEALGAEVVEVDVRSREDAEDPAVAAAVDGAGLVYLSGGNPGFLADTLRGTAVGGAIAAAWTGGAAVAGCSAGAMALGRRTLSPRSRGTGGRPVEGLGLAGDVVVIPHFDRGWFAGRLAGRAVALAADVEGGGDPTVVGIDEGTAVVWHPAEAVWRSAGVGRTWILHGPGHDGPEDRTAYGPGEVVPLPAPPPPTPP